MDFINYYYIFKTVISNTHACIILLLFDIRRYYKFKLYNNTYICIYIILIIYLYNISKCVILEELKINVIIYIYTETLLF